MTLTGHHTNDRQHLYFICLSVIVWQWSYVPHATLLHNHHPRISQLKCNCSVLKILKKIARTNFLVQGQFESKSQTNHTMCKIYKWCSWADTLLSCYSNNNHNTSQFYIPIFLEIFVAFEDLLAIWFRWFSLTC